LTRRTYLPVFFSEFRQERDLWAIPYGANEADAREFWCAVITGTFKPLWPEGHPPTALGHALFEDFGRGAAWKMLPGAREALSLVRQRGLDLAIASNFDGRLLQILADLEVDYDAITISSMLGAAKPAAAFLTHTAAQLAIPPTQLLHIGDNPTEDGGAATAVGACWLPVDRTTGIDLPALTKLLQTD
jgi:FMN phosphatase YigB (HAD superfamily)